MPLYDNRRDLSIQPSELANTNFDANTVCLVILTTYSGWLLLACPNQVAAVCDRNNFSEASRLRTRWIIGTLFSSRLKTSNRTIRLYSCIN